MTEKLSTFDEGVKEIMMSLFSMGAMAYEADYIAKQMEQRPEPIEQKIEAFSHVKKVKPNISFDQAYRKLMDFYQIPPEQNNQSDISVNEIANYIIPSEIIGNNLNSPENKKFFTPYKDDVGLWTIGIGHLIGNGSDRDKNIFVSKNGNTLTSRHITALFRKDLNKHVNNAKSKFPNHWELFTPNLKKVLVDISYRGDLFDPKSKSDFDFVRSIKNNNFKRAAAQYLDHTEYKQRISKKYDGVVKRMNRNSRIIASEPIPTHIATK